MASGYKAVTLAAAGIYEQLHVFLFFCVFFVYRHKAATFRH
jgi:hypothetical protein